MSWPSNNKVSASSNIGFGIGLGAPYEVDIFQLCSPSNPLMEKVWPCYALNSGTIVSVGLGCAALMALIGGYLLFMGSNQLDLPRNNDWSIALLALTKHVVGGCVMLTQSSVFRVGLWGLFWAAVLLVTFTLRQRVDLSDGIRISGAFLFGLVLLLTSLTIGFRMVPSCVSRVVNCANSSGGLKAAFLTAFSAGAGASFLSVGLGFLGLTGIFLLLTLDRDDPTGAFARECKCTCTLMHTQAHAHTRTRRTCMRTRTKAHTHTHTYTRTRASFLSILKMGPFPFSQRLLPPLPPTTLPSHILPSSLPHNSLSTGLILALLSLLSLSPLLPSHEPPSLSTSSTTTHLNHRMHSPQQRVRSHAPRNHTLACARAPRAHTRTCTRTYVHTRAHARTRTQRVHT